MKPQRKRDIQKSKDSTLGNLIDKNQLTEYDYYKLQIAA